MDPSLILWDIIDTHLDEAAFLFGLRERCLDAGHYTLSQVERGPEARLLAQLDGLIVGGQAVAERRLWPLVEDPSAHPGAIAAASLALLASVSTEGCERLLAVLADAKPKQRSAIVHALSLSEREGLPAWQIHQLRHREGAARAGLLAAIATRGWLDDDLLVAMLGDDRPDERVALVELARFCVRPEALRAVSEAARSDDPTLVQAAIETALIRGYRGIERWARHYALLPDAPHGRRSLEWLALLGDPGDLDALLGLLGDQARRPDALWALACSGRVAAVDAAIELLDGELGPRAAELVHVIAGLPRDEDRYWLAPAPEQASPTPALEDDDLDADLRPPEDASLPRPEPDAVRGWWRARRRTLDPAQRYLFGQPWDRGLVHALSEGPTRRRQAFALGLAIASGGRQVVHTCALCQRQRLELARLSHQLDTPTLAEAS